MSGRRAAPLAAGLFAALVALALDAPATRGEPAARTPAEPLRYRMHYAPAGDEARWPVGAGAYVPIERAEFERLLDTIGTAPPDALSPAATQLTSAVYSARLDEATLIGRHARLAIQHAGTTATLLPLAPCGLAVATASWDGGRGGATLGAGADGRMAVLVEKPGTLLLDWSLRGQPDATGGFHFQLELPACPQTRLELDLPEALAPHVEQGVVQPAGGALAGRRAWVVELGGHHRQNLRVIRTDAATQRRRMPLARTSTTYELSPQGISVVAQYRLDILQEPTARFELLLDPGLQLTDARHEDTAVNWTASTTGDEGQSHVVVELPQPIRGAGRLLRFTALAPLVLDAKFRLPRLQPVDMAWQEGSVTLVVPAPLVIEHLVPTLSRQLKLSTLAAGESVELQCFGPDATAELLIARHLDKLRADLGTTVRLGGGDKRAEVVVDYRLPAGERFQIQADVASGWQLDSVQTEPATALADWTLAAPQGDAQLLTLQLAHAVSPDHPLLVRIAAHAAATTDRALRPSDLRIVRLHNAIVETHLLGLSAIKPFQLRVENDHDVERIDPRLASAQHKRLLAGGLPIDWLAHLGPHSGGWRAALEHEASRLAVIATADDRQLSEAYQLAVSPEAGPIDHLLVHFSQRRSESPRFVLAMSGGAYDRPQARQLDEAAERAAGIEPGGETWDVRLPRSTNQPFELRAQRATPLADALPLAMVSLPGVAGQQGTLTIRASADLPLVVENRRLTPLVSEPRWPPAWNQTRVVLQYEPERETGASDPAIVLRRHDDQATRAGATAWHLRLDSRVAPRGPTLHWATLHVERLTARACRLQIPPEAQLLDVWINATRVAAKAVAGTVALDLPTTERLSTIVVHFATPAPAFHLWGRVHPIDVTTDLPVRARQAVLWLPPDFEVPGLAASRGTNGRRPLAWTERLFGPLSRPSDEPPFDPLAVRAWEQMSHVAPRTWFAAGDDLAEPDGEFALGLDAGDWPAPPGIATAASFSRGWRAVAIDASDAAPRSLPVVRRAVGPLAGWLSMLAVVALGLWRTRRQRLHLGGLVAGLAVLALVVPEAWVPLASGAMLGAAVCLLAGLLRPAASGEPARSASARASAAVVAGAALLVAWSGLVVAAHAAPSEPTVYSVFVPIDEQGQPTGGRYQIPLAMSDELRRRAEEALGVPRGWLLHGATYRATLARDTQSGLDVTELIARYDVRVFDSSARIVLPVSRAAVSGMVRLLVDGRSVPLEWAEDGQSLACLVPGPGTTRLELGLRPTLALTGDLRGFDLAIPPLADSQLELHLPHDAPPVDVPGAVGETTSSDEGQVRTVRLGPAARLTVRWPLRATAPAGPTLDVEELLWLKVRPGSVVIDARFAIKPVTGSVRELRLTVDPRLRMLPLPAQELGVAEIRTLSAEAPAGDDDRVIQLNLLRPATDRAVLQASFLLTGASGVGNVRIPRLELQGARPTRRCVGVTVDAALESEPPRGDQVQPLAVTNFAALWGDAKMLPQFAGELPREPGLWSLATRVRRAQTTAGQFLVVSYDQSRAAVRYEAQLMTSDGAVFQHRLLAPPALDIENISVLEDGAQRAARWARDASGTITIFLSGPVTGAQQLSLRGSIAASYAGPNTLPFIRLDENKAVGMRISVYRQHAALVRLDKLVGLVESPEGVVPERDAEHGRLVSALVVGHERPSARVVLDANHPKVQVAQVTAVRYDERAWQASIDCEWHVEHGLVDALRWEIPAEWAGPFTVTPPLAMELDEPDASGRRRLVIYPRKPVDRALRVSIAGPLGVAPGGAPAVPDVHPLGADRTRRYYLLPATADARPVSWETNQLRPATLPETFAATPALKGSQPYQVAGSAPVARLASTTADGGLVREHRDCLGVAVFVVAAGGAASCTIEMPAQSQLRQARVEGWRVAPQSLDERRLRVPLPPTAQARVTLWFTSDPNAGNAAGQQPLESPRVLDHPVESTSWTILGPADQPSTGKNVGWPTWFATWPELPHPPEWTTAPATRDDASSTTASVPGHEGALRAARQRWAMAAAIGLGAAGIGFLRRRWGAPLADWPRRWPHALGVVVGLAWWLWLSPSVFGLLLALVCALGSLKSGLSAREAALAR